jgi:Tol biopolymer transport system component
LPGDRIVWSHNSAPGPHVFDSALVACRLGETNYQVLTDWKGGKGLQAVSPDGRQIVFSRQATPESTPELWIMDTDGRNLRRFTELKPPHGQPQGLFWFGRR